MFEAGIHFVLFHRPGLMAWIGTVVGVISHTTSSIDVAEVDHGSTIASATASQSAS
jgi:hypothetical protein